jgi:hypothetical protein
MRRSEAAKEEGDAIRALNESVHHHLEDLKDVLENAFGRVLYLQYNFDYISPHDQFEDLVIDGDNDSLCKSACLRNCTYFPLKLAGMYLKQYTHFFQSIISCQKFDFESIVPFGTFTAFQFLDSLQFNDSIQVNKSDSKQCDTTCPLVSRDSNIIVQGGGGSGYGFQVYCDDHLVMSTGAGGGGGFYLSASNRTISVGGGGGGGLQLFYSNSSLAVSVGGGGGCGVESGYKILCGFVRDASNVSDANLLDVASEVLAPEALEQCKVLSVQGGGGGGGGTGACCKPWHFGYGYSFTLTSAPFFSTEDSTNSSQATSRYLRGGDVDHNSSDSSGYNGDNNWEEKTRFEYDIVGRILHESAAAYCNNSMSNWNCVVTNSKNKIKYCLSLYNATAHEGKNTQPYLEDCDYIVEHYAQISWLGKSLAGHNNHCDQSGKLGCTDEDNEGNVESIGRGYEEVTSYRIPNYFDYVFSNDSSPTRTRSINAEVCNRCADLPSSMQPVPAYFSVYMNSHEEDSEDSSVGILSRNGDNLSRQFYGENNSELFNSSTNNNGRTDIGYEGFWQCISIAPPAVLTSPSLLSSSPTFFSYLLHRFTHQGHDNSVNFIPSLFLMSSLLCCFFIVTLRTCLSFGFFDKNEILPESKKCKAAIASEGTYLKLGQESLSVHKCYGAATT